MSHESLKTQPDLKALFKKHGRKLPHDQADQGILNRLYEARLSIGRNGIGEEFNSILPGNRQERKQTAARLKTEIKLVVDCTPSLSRRIPPVNPFRTMGIVTVSDGRELAAALRSN